jgi:hypothetical protein
MVVYASVSRPLLPCTLALALVCASRNVAPVPAALFVVRGARVFDGERVLPSASVLVRDGRIAAVGEEVAIPQGAGDIERVSSPLVSRASPAFRHWRRVRSYDQSRCFPSCRWL